MKRVEYWLNKTKPHYMSKYESVQMALLLLCVHTSVEEHRGSFLHITTHSDDATIDQLCGICPIADYNEILQP